MAATGTTPLASITKWDGPKLVGNQNFAEWQQYIISVCVAADVYHHVEHVEVPNSSAVSRRKDTVPAPPPDPSKETPEETKARIAAKETKSDNDAKQKRWMWGLLYNSLHTSVASRLSAEASNPTTHDPVALWEELHKRYDRTKGIRAAQLQAQLTSMRLKPNGNVEHHFNNMRDIYNRMILSGQTFSDVQLAYAMITSLPEEYSVLAGVVARAPNISSDYVQEEITAEWERLGMPGKDDDLNDASSSGDKGLLAKSKTSSKSQRPPRKFKCTEHPSANSHDTKDCYVLQRKAKEAAKAKDKKKKKKKVEESSDSEDSVDVAAIATYKLGEESDEDIFGFAAIEPIGLAALDEETYIIDSGAIRHMVTIDCDMSDLVPFSHKITVGGRGTVHSTHRGTLTVGELKLHNVLFVPDLGFNLLSVGCFSDEGYKTVFENGTCVIRDADNKIILQVRGNGLYEIKASSMTASLVAQTHSADMLLYLHRSLGHLNWNDVYKIARSGRLGDEWRSIINPKSMNILCEECVKAKGRRLPSPPSTVRAVRPNQIVHVDLWGPAKTTSVGGSRYFLTCYDDWSHRIQVYLLKNKSEVPSAFKKYLALVNNQCTTLIKQVRSDNGGEFTSQTFEDLLETHGIIHKRVPPAAHAQNGRVERVHLTIMNLVRAMLLDSGLGKEFWSEAAAYAVFIRNRVPKRNTMDIPQELWTGQKCEITQLRPFGSTVYVRDHTNLDKLSPRYIKARLMGFRSYSEETIRYYDPKTGNFNYSRDYLFERKTHFSEPVILSSDLLKQDNAPRSVPPPTSVPSSSSFGIEPSPEDAEASEAGTVDEPSVNKDSPIPPVSEEASSSSVEPPVPPPPKTRSKNVTYKVTTEPRGTSRFEQAVAETPASFIDSTGKRVMPRRNRTTAAIATAFGDLASDVVAVLEIEAPVSSGGGHVDPIIHILGLMAQADSVATWCLLATDCPKTVRQALSGPDAPKWWKAMLDELAKLQNYDVYEEVNRTEDMRVLRARWVFTRKVDGDTGDAAAYKARWVAKGFTQVEGLDFNEIFASVAHKDTLRVFLAMVNWNKLHCHQVDIVAAFLNGDLKETLYMEPPEGLDVPAGKVYKLKKSLYGLRQSPRCFNDKLDGWLRTQRFVPATADPCLYIRRESGVFMMLTVHVDDQLIASNDESALLDFKARLNAEFGCTDHGPVNYFLGFNVKRDVENRASRSLRNTISLTC